jgi:hypothetical protein
MPKHIHTGNAVLFILWLASAILTYFGIEIYRLTIVDKGVLFAISILGAFAFYFLLMLLPKSNYSKFWVTLVRISMGLGLSFFLFLFLNKTFLKEDIVSREFSIAGKGHLPASRMANGCAQPYIVIDFDKVEKELVFYCHFEREIKNSTRVELRYSEGLLGYNYIRSIVLKK